MSEPSEITYIVEVDWDATDWRLTPDFSQADDDISDDVQDIPAQVTGEEKDAGNSPPGTCEIALKPGLIDKYNPFNAAGALYGKIRPWLPVRIQATHNGTTCPFFAGFIKRIRIDPDPDREIVYFYLTDGSDLLARQKVTQDFDNRAAMSDGAAVNKLLDAAGWPAARRDISLDGGDDLLNYPQTGEY